MSAPRPPREARDKTDATLGVERHRTDDELLARSTALGEDADEVVRLARIRAREVLELARRDVDRTMADAGVGDEAMASVADERRLEDEALRAGHASADATLEHERERRRQAILHLLAVERAETNSTLATERTIADGLVAARDDVLGVVSHDLRGQLNTLLFQAAQIIEERPDDERLVRDAYLMQRTVAKMSKVLEDLLDLASMEGGRARIARAPTDVVAAVADEVDTHRPAAAACRVELSLRAGEPSLIAEVDRARLGRVVMNLLGNALKFTPAGGRIVVDVHRDGDEVAIAVADTGPGIAPDQLAAVFDRFQQLDRGRHRAGYGLGLYIARAIVDAHDGRIWAESANGEGATFRVALPLRAAARAPDVASRQALDGI